MIAAKIELVQPLIGFNSGTLVMVFITFCVLLLILKKFFWDKVRTFMQAREQKIIDEFDNAAEANRVANARLDEYSAKIADIGSERRDILAEAKRRADENAQEIIRQAEEKARQIVDKAGEQIEYEKERALSEMREQIGMLAVYAAEKIIEKQLDPAGQQAIIGSVLEEAESRAWKI
ncbi:MAG: F0F1 ATP synthase subunit B [Clostridiales Family XIII bacterium]|jgi:F-type H+-transporting ATPase subunit b|nr:F0F1 ATP synthase subunit B [Clostridiales Family XIII bacterium]